jgi:hypothetical protein
MLQKVSNMNLSIVDEKRLQILIHLHRFANQAKVESTWSVRTDRWRISHMHVCYSIVILLRCARKRVNARRMHATCRTDCAEVPK